MNMMASLYKCICVYIYIYTVFSYIRTGVNQNFQASQDALRDMGLNVGADVRACVRTYIRAYVRACVRACYVCVDVPAWLHFAVCLPVFAVWVQA